MITYELSDITDPQYAELLRRGDVFEADAAGVARAVCTDVRDRGDEAVREYSERFDGTAAARLRVDAESIERAHRDLDPAILAALDAAASNIRRFHEAQLAPEPRVETQPGVVCWRERRSYRSVGLYVPAGSAPLPSTVLMLGIPAMIAGTPRVALCSPPREGGDIDPCVLAAARVVGIDEIYRVGGAQAIAAMAYGTESIPRVDKVFGPGNRFVAAAKQFVSADRDGAAIDMLAGPSELMVIADAGADARIVAADLVSQAEHDADARVVLAATSRAFVVDVLRWVDRFAAELPRRDIISASLARSFAIVTDGLDAAVHFANDYAPEHLIVNTEMPELLLPGIVNAGSVFVGAFAPVTAGDYASGTNHTLPTGGAARWMSGLTMESFTRTVSFQRITEPGLRSLAPVLTTLSRAEGLAAHALAVTERMREGGRQ